VLVTGGAGGIDHLGDIVLEDLANATFNRLLQRVRRLLRREYFFPRGGEGAFPGKKRNKKDGKFGVSAVYARENANYFRKSPGTKGRGGIGCDGVGGSAVFVTGALGFKAASHIVLRLMEAGDGADDGDEENRGKKTNKGRPAAAGWRSRVWPRGKAGGGDSGGGDGGGDGGGGGGGGGGDGESPGDGDDSRDGGDGGRDDGADEILSSASFATAVAFAATASLDDEATAEPAETTTIGEASTTSMNDAQNDRNPRTARGELSRELSNAVQTKDIFDAHCHWHLDRADTGEAARLAGALAGAAFTSTCPDDWIRADQFAERSAACDAASDGDGYYCVALGLHPWWAHRFPPPAAGGWPDDLRARLRSCPRAVVGEIGLDRVAVPLDEVTGERTGEPADYANQMACFAAQLAIAAEERRPAVVHCVKAYGDAGDAFRARETFPTKVLMHSYGGTAAFAEGLVRMKKWGPRFYFGFSSVVNLRSPKTADVIRAIPADRLVIESDLTSSRGAEDALRAMLAAVAECRGWTPEETARITRENARRFYLPEREEA
jgi:TatD DNase family protein